MKKILVIDDAEFILESTSTLLTFEGYEVLTAADGEEGLKLAFEHKPDLILCDISMPKIDGYEVLERIRANQSTSTIPFIFLTAFTEKENMRLGMQKGADDFLVKPYTRDELINAINAQWNKHTLIEKQVKEKVETVGKSVTYALPHEFRTVLNEVIGWSKYLNANYKEITPEELKELSGDIIASATRLMKITENFLLFVRLQAIENDSKQKKQLKQNVTDQAIGVLTDLVLLKAEKYNRQQDIKFIGEEAEVSIKIGGEFFYKLIDEIVDNALRFSPDGSEVIVNYWLANDFLFIRIADKGRGMTREQLSNITALAQFERDVYEQQGVGLGLVIAQKIVQLHGGTFEIQSKENEGTSVIFSLELKK